MLRRVIFWFCCVLLFGLSTASLAQEIHPDLGQLEIVSFSELGMSDGDGPILDVKTDGVGRVWAINRGRASAASLNSGNWGRAPLFPILPSDVGLTFVLGDGFTSVAFADPAGTTEAEEYFFLGSSIGIAWGRFSVNIDDEAPLVRNPGSSPQDPENAVNGLAADGGAWLWAATEGGLVLWDLATGLTPTHDDTFLTGEGAIGEVEAAPWGDEAIAIAGDRLFRVDVAGTEVELVDLANGTFSGIVFDTGNNVLWAAVTTTIGTPQIMKFEFDATGTLLTPGGVSFSFDPDPPNDAQPLDVAFGWESSRILVTASGAPSTAFYQDLDPGGDLTGTWLEVDADLPVLDTHAVVHADDAGNVWFGMRGDALSPQALNGYILRAIALDDSRYLGGTTGAATLFDLTLTGSGTAPINITVGSDSRDFDAPAAGTSTFVQDFSIVPSDGAGGSGTSFQVSSSVDDIPVVASYTFFDANAEERTITAEASWANIVKFEDDLWIGDPCFLGILGL